MVYRNGTILSTASRSPNPTPGKGIREVPRVGNRATGDRVPDTGEQCGIATWFTEPIRKNGHFQIAKKPAAGAAPGIGSTAPGSIPAANSFARVF
jgi:hypothetical protein